MTGQRTHRHAPWFSAAVAVAVLAVLLGGLGLLLAIRQTQAHATQRIADARPEGKLLAREINELITKSIDAVFRRTIADFAQSGSLADKNAALDRRWMKRLYLYDGTRLCSSPSTEPLPGLPTQPLELLVQGQLALRLKESAEPPGVIRYLHDRPARNDLVLAYRVEEPSDDTRIVLAMSIDPERLQSDLIEPLLATHTRLALSDTMPDASRMEWFVSLTPALPAWVLQPTRRFVDRQLFHAKMMTGVFIGVMVLLVLGMMAVLWGLFHVLERQMALAEMKRDFVATISHELKTPLALIRMFGETLLSGRVSSEEKAKEYYEIITRESTRLTHMIDNILDFSKIEADRKEYDFAPVQVEHVVRQMVESYRHELEHQGFEYHVRIAEPLPEVLADGDALSQALLNLLSNAMKYSSDDKKLDIEVDNETRRGKHGVLISVKDQGIGIRSEERRHVFEGFYRSSDDKVRKKHGAGLGLALVKRIVEAHGGEIDVETRLVKGSRFNIFLPAANNQQ